MFDVKSKFSLLAYIRLSTERRNVDNHYSVSHNQLTNACERQAIIEKAASARAAAEPLTPQAACSHFVLMPLKFPLRVRRYGGDGKVSAFLITDSAGRSINICCEETELRREVAKLFSPEEAEELAKRIARFLTDEHDTEAAIRLRQEEMSNPHSWAYKQQNG